MVSQSEVLDVCLKQAAGEAKTALSRSIDDAVAALQVAETQSFRLVERDLFNQAAKGLADVSADWIMRYETHLLAEFQTAGLSQTTTASSLRQQKAPSPNNRATPILTLMDDSDMSQVIESARLLQHMLPPMEQTLPELDKLISSAQGLTTVHPELNPLRPEIFARCLLDLLYGVAAAPALTTLWIKYLGEPLGRELSRLYENIGNVLVLSDIRGASYRVLQTPSGARADTATSGLNTTASGSASPSGHPAIGQPDAHAPPDCAADRRLAEADLSRPDVTADLFQNFLYNRGAPAAQTVSPAYRAKMLANLAALAATDEQLPGRTAACPLGERRDAVLVEPARLPSSAYQALPAVDRPPREVSESTALNSQYWGSFAQPRTRALVRTRLKAEASEVSQVMGLEVVRQLVNEVAQDARLLAPVRESIVALEPALGRLAMQDPRFFGDEKHPGRLLIERVAQRSFKYNDEFSPEFGAFFKPLTQTFNALNGDGVVDAGRFDTALAALENQWAAHDKAEAARQLDMLKKMRFAEARQTQADEIAYEMSNRSDLEDVPGMVLDFLFGHWSLAMAHARLCDTRNQLDPGGLGSAVPDLVWSAKPKATIRQPAKLIEMIPGLLGKLHSGLQMLGSDAEECAPFFDGLMTLHQPVLKLRRLRSQRDARESSPAPLSVPASLMEEIANAESVPATAEQRRAKVNETPWLGKHELADAGFQDTLPTDYGDLAPQTEVDPADTPAPDAAQVQPPSLEHPAGTAAHNDVALADSVLTQVPALQLPAVPEAAPATTGGAEVVPALPLHAPSAAEAMLLALRAGDWVDLYSRKHWLRAQLTWTSTKGTLFMFVSHGGQPHSMTKRSCERLIAGRLLRPVNSHGVVSRALETVAANAKALPKQSAEQAASLTH